MAKVKVEVEREELSSDLVRGRQQLDAWRQSDSRGVAIPPKLWDLAARLARRHGNFRTARALGLDSGKLKRVRDRQRRAGGVRVRGAARAGRAAAQFVEVSGIVAPASVGAGCRMTLSGPQGEQLQMELAPEAAAVLLAQLCRSGWAAARP
jgi:hypothetical protein